MKSDPLRFRSRTPIAVGRSLAPLFSSQGVGVAVFDRQFKFEAVNESLAAMNGLDISAHLEKNIRDILGPFAGQLEPYFALATRTGKSVTFESKGQIPTRQKPGHWIATYIPIPSGPPETTKVCALILEVTEKKKLDDALFSLAGKLLFLRNTLNATLSQLSAPGDYPDEDRFRLLRSVEVFDECATDIADFLSLVRPATSVGRANNPSSKPSRPIEHIRQPATTPPLSSRETEVLRLIASNKANKEIAAILSISVRTVEAHRRRLMDKLNIHSLTELVHHAIRSRIVEP
jgi:DNA-binding CsgD family transcriptional regulator